MIDIPHSVKKNLNWKIRRKLKDIFCQKQKKKNDVHNVFDNVFERKKKKNLKIVLIVFK